MKAAETLADARHDWTRKEIAAIYEQSLLDLVGQAREVHLRRHNPRDMQLCQLISIKTGGCPEDCAYCPQSAHYETDVDNENLLDVDAVLSAAARARDEGVHRFCMGAAWRGVRDGPEFERVLEMVRGVAGMGLETCCTLGMLNESQAERLAEAGLHAYNHNLDTSPEYYEKIITTRTYRERLDTLAAVRKAGITVCSGGSSAWASPTTTAWVCFISLQSWIPTPKACRSTCWFRSTVRPLRRPMPSIR